MDRGVVAHICSAPKRADGHRRAVSKRLALDLGTSVDENAFVVKLGDIHRIFVSHTLYA